MTRRGFVARHDWFCVMQALCSPTAHMEQLMLPVPIRLNMQGRCARMMFDSRFETHVDDSFTQATDNMAIERCDGWNLLNSRSQLNQLSCAAWFLSQTKVWSTQLLCIYACSDFDGKLETCRQSMSGVPNTIVSWITVYFNHFKVIFDYNLFLNCLGGFELRYSRPSIWKLALTCLVWFTPGCSIQNWRHTPHGSHLLVPNKWQSLGAIFTFLCKLWLATTRNCSWIDKRMDSA